MPNSEPMTADLFLSLFGREKAPEALLGFGLPATTSAETSGNFGPSPQKLDKWPTWLIDRVQSSQPFTQMLVTLQKSWRFKVPGAGNAPLSRCKFVFSRLQVVRARDENVRGCVEDWGYAPLGMKGEAATGLAGESDAEDFGANEGNGPEPGPPRDNPPPKLAPADPRRFPANWNNRPRQIATGPPSEKESAPQQDIPQWGSPLLAPAGGNGATGRQRGEVAADSPAARGAGGAEGRSRKLTVQAVAVYSDESKSAVDIRAAVGGVAVHDDLARELSTRVFGDSRLGGCDRDAEDGAKVASEFQVGDEDEGVAAERGAVQAAIAAGSWPQVEAWLERHGVDAAVLASGESALSWRSRAASTL
ncbi:unnamed protein product [Prorocentrum cordatum]|uniref:Uncharacterized protein n=1 Tax=Prorocentrum cordatum TaxID=2364126 RepID=A0ABN9R1L2_9DINO|nr:unnamed protein product [Polarella glacialis]